MTHESASAPGIWQRLRTVLRNDLYLTSIGFGFTAILLAAMAAAAWWAGRTQDEAIAKARADWVGTVGRSLARSAETMLADGRLTSVRRLVVETARDADLARCRIVLPDGQTVADATPQQITVASLPETWAGTPAASPPTEGGLSQSFPLAVGDRGQALLQVAGKPDPLGDVYWQTRAGIGAVCVVALLTLMLMHRRFRSAFRGIWAVRQGLAAYHDGQQTPGALKVNPDWGPEAQAWNDLLDRTEKAQRQAALAQTQESLQIHSRSSSQLSAACDALSQGLILVDANMQATYANGAASVLLRTRNDAIEGAEVSTFIQEEHVVTAVREATERPMQRRQIFEIERCDETGHTVQLRFIVRPVRREDSASVMIVIEDITQQRVAENARNAFVAQATHELRTPLTNIRLYAEMGLDEGQGDPAMQANCLSVINQEVSRLDRIVGDILSVSEIEAGSLRLNLDDVRLSDLFEALQVDYAAQAREKHVALEFHLPPKLPVIRGDREKIALAIHNLVGNALKYTPDGGSVTVTVDADEDRFAVEVADTGIGIAPEDCRRVFEKFYRSPDQRVSKIEGSGLGLAIAREVIRLHGGDVTVDSEVDQGSTFTLTLPVTEGVPVA